MMVIFNPAAPKDEIERLRALLLTCGCEVRQSSFAGRYLLLAEREWPEPPIDLVSQLRASEHVESVIHPGKPYSLVAKESKSKRSVVAAGFAIFGGEEPPALIAGPCTVEDEQTLLEIARAVKTAGATGLRGGAFKPATSPYSFQGHGERALAALRRVADETQLAAVTEVMDTRLVETVSQYADIVQVGARNMQNFDLLKEVGRQDKPVLLKRSMASTIDEWLCAAEYIAREGNERIILCERGIRTFERATRNTLDVSAVPIVKSLSHLPVIVDPSHAAGTRKLVLPLSLAAVAAGADGLIVEVHTSPERAIKDGSQTINTEEFALLASVAESIARTVRGESRVEVL